MPDQPEPFEVAADPRAYDADRITINPKLSATLQEECDSLRNDLQQANDLAAAFQRQLASKSNEVATMKQLFARTRGHLMQLQNSIKELRQERHLLANEAMKATAANGKLLEECDLLRHDLQSLLQALDGCGHDILQLAETFKRQVGQAATNRLAMENQSPRELILPSVPTSDVEVKWVG